MSSVQLQLALTKAGTPRICQSNVIEILENDPRYKARLSWCAFRDVILLDGDPLEQHWIGELGFDLGRRYALHGGERLLEWSVDTVARRYPLDPLIEYLGPLEWDGEDRLDRWLQECLQVEDDGRGLISAMGRKWMISAVARALRPGCKVDTVLVLHGPQGTRKSTAIEVLASDDWYMSSSIDVRSKDARVALQGKWLVEWAELDALKKADANAAKAFITERADDYRPPYGRHNVKRHRRCVFVGTTNDPTFLADTTGDRRFWVVTCGEVDLEKLEAWRDQLWAEAVARLQAEENWWLDKAQEALRSEHTERYQMADPWVDLAAVWIRANYPMGGFTGEELLTDQGERNLHSGGWRRVPGIGMDGARASAHALGRLAKVLTHLGLEQRRVTKRGRKVRLWYPVLEEDEETPAPDDGTKGDQAAPVQDIPDAW